MAVTGEVETSDESEPSTDSDNQRLCPYCGYNYAYNSSGCDHLLCTVEFVESNNELVEALDHPIVASLYGLDVPRVVAGRFMNYLRSQTRLNGAHSWDNAQGVRITDLLSEKRARGGVVSIKCSREEHSCFREWTYYLTITPADSMKQFGSFVRKQYCPSVSENEFVVPFSRVRLLPGIITLDVADLTVDAYEPGQWVMLTGMPDNLPLFFFSVTALTPDNPTMMMINHGENIINRMRNWSSPPSYVSLIPLTHLPSVLLN
eukprot:Phypoly_transcript_11061.p1 GENE.Phypoly_transcript_11061~~Phypoly_transcript_11061.p1  ORF type:complete len:261 (+),score=12.30 Phypoly_transcript_11061:215-997(+)